MKLWEHNGVHCIQADEHESFWGYQVIDHRHPPASPRIKTLLAQWWDATAPGEWTTAYCKRIGVICIRDPKLFVLFKLTWQGSEVIRRPVETEAGAFYTPYIPLVITSATVDTKDTK